MTSPAQELAQHRRWKLQPRYAALRVFDQLLENEFRSPQEQEASQSAAARAIIRFASVHTPYYANLFARSGLRAEDFDSSEDLIKLPILRKQDVLQFYEELTSQWLPTGQKVFGPARSSGTTGQPVTVLHSHESTMMFGILRHRSSRWFGLDPAQSRVDVRQHSNLLQQARGEAIPGDGVVRRPSWHQLGEYFHTGPEFVFSISTPMERQVALLRQLRPHYAMSYPGIFEEWLLAGEGQVPVDSLEALIGIGAELRPPARRYLEENYRIPIEQAYGLNEIGAVAVRCSAGRYHVNIEHCLVEIVAGDGQPCTPGQTGHVLVTGFRNLAMPLIRYDTGDLAEAVSGPCPCGRTLPSFGEIAGRHRSYAGLPKGTRERVGAIRAAMKQCSPGELAFLRRYQIHQDRENRFTLRLRIAAPIPETFRQFILRAWEPFAGMPPEPLTIAGVDEIAPPAHGKPLDFTSDFHDDSPSSPPPQRAVPPESGI